jgi:hypothetical protein
MGNENRLLKKKEAPKVEFGNSIFSVFVSNFVQSVGIVLISFSAANKAFRRSAF